MWTFCIHYSKLMILPYEQLLKSCKWLQRILRRHSVSFTVTIWQEPMFIKLASHKVIAAVSKGFYNSLAYNNIIHISHGSEGDIINISHGFEGDTKALARCVTRWFYQYIERDISIILNSKMNIFEFILFTLSFIAVWRHSVKFRVKSRGKGWEK